MKQHQRHPKASKASQKNSSQEDPNLTILSSSTLSTNDQKRNTNHLKYFSTPNLDHQSSSIFPCLFSSDNDQTLKKIGNDSSKNESFYQEHIFEVTLKCFCKKTFSKKWRFLKHLKAFHNFHLLSELYPKFRMIL